MVLVSMMTQMTPIKENYGQESALFAYGETTDMHLDCG